MKHVEEFYNSYYCPSVSTITIVGDISKDKILNKLSFLKDWKNKENFEIPNKFEYPEDESNTNLSNR